MRYQQITNKKGQFSKWSTPKKGYRLACCDCGLVHDIDFMAIKKGSVRIDGRTIQIKFRVRRNERATAAMRRGSKTTPRIVFKPL